MTIVVWSIIRARQSTSIHSINGIYNAMESSSEIRDMPHPTKHRRYIDITCTKTKYWEKNGQNRSDKDCQLKLKIEEKNLKKQISYQIRVAQRDIYRKMDVLLLNKESWVLNETLAVYNIFCHIKSTIRSAWWMWWCVWDVLICSFKRKSVQCLLSIGWIIEIMSIV